MELSLAFLLAIVLVVLIIRGVNITINVKHETPTIEGISDTLYDEKGDAVGDDGKDYMKELLAEIHDIMQEDNEG